MRTNNINEENENDEWRRFRYKYTKTCSRQLVIKITLFSFSFQSNLIESTIQRITLSFQQWKCTIFTVSITFSKSFPNKCETWKETEIEPNCKTNAMECICQIHYVFLPDISTFLYELVNTSINLCGAITRHRHGHTKHSSNDNSFESCWNKTREHPSKAPNGMKSMVRHTDDGTSWRIVQAISKYKQFERLFYWRLRVNKILYWAHIWSGMSVGWQLFKRTKRIETKNERKKKCDFVIGKIIALARKKAIKFKWTE